MDGAGLWDELDTSWICLDCEITPWSAKAESLIRQQYAATGAAAGASLAEAVAMLELAAARNSDSRALLERYQTKAAMASRYVNAYRNYCWPVKSVSDLRLAPFHLLASEGAVHADKDHAWHLAMLDRLCTADAAQHPQAPILAQTAHRVVTPADRASEDEAIRWWEDLTAGGGEGIVVKPQAFVARARRGLVQPALKVRGREYLRIIYGPEYDMPEHLDRLRARAVASKRSLALREFSLGLETLYRFVEGEPLYRVHECAFGVLALESEPIDPRL